MLSRGFEVGRQAKKHNIVKLKSTEKEKVLHEITPVIGSNIIYILDMKHKVFDYPIHTHEVFELNFIERAPGALRIVGDSREEIDDMDLVLIANENLEHIWEQHNYRGDTAREVTIQFALRFGEDHIFSASAYADIRRMMILARRGIAFPKESIMKVYHLLDTIGDKTESFYAIQGLITILYELSKTPSVRILASRDYVNDAVIEDNEKINAIKGYLNKHYREEVTLGEASRIAGMSISSFGRFFKQQTGSTLSEYLIMLRLTYATTQLIETERTIADICYSSGFNNMSHFNRMFKRNKGCTPKMFRDTYRRRVEYDSDATARAF